MSHHSDKPSDRGIGVWLWEISNGLHMFLTGLYPVFHDTMCEIDDFTSEQATFGGLKLQVFHPKPVKNNPHMM